MKKTIYLSCFAAILAVSSAANAKEYFEGVPLDLSANATWVSDYRYRGISQTDEKPALQIGADAIYALTEDVDFYASVWGSNVDFNDSNEARHEIDYMTGFATQIDGVALELGTIYYDYPAASQALNYDFLEYTASAGYDFNGLFASYSVNYSNDFFGSSGEAWYNKLSLEYSFYPNFKLNSYIGRQTIEKNAVYGVANYYDWGFGGSYNYDDIVTLGVNYVDMNTSTADCPDNCDGVLLFSVSKTF